MGVMDLGLPDFGSEDERYSRRDDDEDESRQRPEDCGYYDSFMGKCDLEVIPIFPAYIFTGRCKLENGSCSSCSDFCRR